MRIDNTTSIVRIEPAILNELVKEVKETLATNIQMSETAKPKFTSIDMWNIHRNARTARSRFSW